jgi:GNAT superfamily N-acetyltransferase
MNLSNLIVRTGLLEDLAFIVDAQLNMAKETEDKHLDKSVVLAGVQHLFNNPFVGKYYLAEYENRPVACFLALFEWSDWRNGNVIWIHSLYVIPEFRARGVFKFMYEHLKEEVQSSEDLRGIRLYVDKRNTKAQAVYEKLGMNADHYALYEWMCDF